VARIVTLDWPAHFNICTLAASPSRIQGYPCGLFMGTSHAHDDDVESGHGGRKPGIDMPTLDDRVTHVEGRMMDLREEMRRGFDRIDNRFAQIDGRFAHFDVRLLSLEQKVDRQFVWLVGIQLTTMLTVVGVLAAAFFRTQ
jgi:hypothetical protein